MDAERRSQESGKASSGAPGATRRLGRGLGSLIPTPSTPPPQHSAPRSTNSIPVSGADPNVALDVSRGTPAEMPGSPSRSVLGQSSDAHREIPVDLVVPNPHQPRETFNQASISELAESIRSAGLLQPIVVRPANSGDGATRFELIAGERRLRAVKSLGRATIPAIIRHASDRESAQLALIENIQRDDLNPVERAFGLRALADEFSMSHQQVADSVGLDRASVTNLIRLTELDGRSLDLIRHGKLSAGHARALLSIRDVATRSLLADTAIMEEWSVRTLEREVQRAVDRSSGSKVPRGTSNQPIRSAHLSSLEDQLSRALGTRVHLQLGRKKGAGRMTIEFFSLEQFDGLMSRLGVTGSISA